MPLATFTSYVTTEKVSVRLTRYSRSPSREVFHPHPVDRNGDPMTLVQIDFAR